VLLTLFILSGKSRRAVIVDQNNSIASDDNPGSAGQAFRSIHKASDVRAPRPRAVKAGLYAKWVPLYHSGTRETPIRIQADPPGSVTVLGSSGNRSGNAPGSDPASVQF